MTDLRGAIAGLDGLLGRMDGVLSRAATLDETVRVADLDLAASASAVREALGPAMPDQIAAFTAQLPHDASMQVGELAVVRADLARLGAAAKGVEQLGGAEHVAAQGGLDAIDGAAGIVQRHIIDDAQRQLAGIRQDVDRAPGGVFSGKGSRIEYLRRMRARTEAGRETLVRGGGLTNAPGIDFATALQDYRLSRDGFATTLSQLRAWADALPGSAAKPTTPAWVADNLVSTRAQEIAVERSLGDIAPVEPLRGKSIEEVLDRAPQALDKHIALMERLRERVGDASYYSDGFAQPVRAMREHVTRAVQDARTLHAMLEHAPDRARNAAYLVDDWGSYLLEHAGSWNARDNGPKMLPTTIEQLRALREEMARIADDPQLLHAATEAEAEVRSILERPGTLDVGAIRDLLAGDVPHATSQALARLVADLKPHLPEAPAASSVDEARRLLDEADVISDAVRRTAGKQLGSDEQILLNDDSVRAAVEDLLLRRQAALGMSDRVPESVSGAVRSGIDGLEKKLTVFEAQYDMYLPRVRDLDGIDESARAYRDELLKVTDRASADGGLRAISPSARPSQARAAQSSWLMRELDSLPAIAADAPPETYIDTSARRVALVADLLESSGASRYGTGTADGDVLRRAGSEILSMDDLWRYPDDTALRLASARRTVQAGSWAIGEAATQYKADSNLVAQLRTSAADLRAWSALPDGTLPHTSTDRISVAARRSDAMRMASERRVTVTKDSRTGDLVRFVTDMDERLGDLDTVLGGAMPRAERIAVDDALASVRANLDDYQELLKAYKGSDWTYDEQAVQVARERIADLDAAIARVQADARATDAEHLTW
jgi:hypothetical protein